MAVKFTCQLVAYTTLKLLQIDSCHLDIWNSDCMKDAQGSDKLR